MSWYTDPQLFIEKSVTVSQYVEVQRCLKEIGSPVDKYDFKFQESVGSVQDYSKYFSNLVTEIDIVDVFNASFPNHRDLLVNCEGWVVHWDALAPGSKKKIWFRVEPNSPFWSLPGLTRKKSETELESSEKQLALEKKVSELEADVLSLDDELAKENDEKNALIDELGREKAGRQDSEKRLSILEAEKSTLKDEKNDLKDKLAVLEANYARLDAKQKELTGDLEIWTREVADVHKQLDREKRDKQALEKIVQELTTKLEECCGGKSTYEEPWLSGYPTPGNFVPFEDLVPGVTRKSRPLSIVKRDDMQAFDEDYTTNVKASYFYRGMVNDRVVYPIVVVNVTELNPNGEKAKFDPSVWSLFNNAGTTYAARNPFPAPIRH